MHSQKTNTNIHRHRNAHKETYKQVLNYTNKRHIYIQKRQIQTYTDTEMHIKKHAHKYSITQMKDTYN